MGMIFNILALVCFVISIVSNVIFWKNREKTELRDWWLAFLFCRFNDWTIEITTHSNKWVGT